MKEVRILFCTRVVWEVWDRRETRSFYVLKSIPASEWSLFGLQEFRNEAGFSGGSVGEESACNTGETWTWEDPLEEGMATHSSILAWRIPWIEDPGGVQSLGSRESHGL